VVLLMNSKKRKMGKAFGRVKTDQDALQGPKPLCWAKRGNVGKEIRFSGKRECGGGGTPPRPLTQIIAPHL